ncbi:MAG: succinate dehydrogenase/fumarate reductase iron-sulfur subunit [Dehalococcoidia bacterium]|nr:succinate dehydrogenase/fumarate reductase iron-sulfur subunit [Dehalococcoidia bacterium]
MQVTYRIKRFDPEVDKTPRFQDFTLQVGENDSVLDGMIKIREEQDGSLALRCSCRAAICGSCAMRVNGEPRLMCKTRIRDAAPEGLVKVEPMGNLPVVKDLVVDMGPFWQKVRAVKPWLEPPAAKPEREYLAPNEAMREVVGVVACIMCGACVSDCTVWEVDPNFLGPAALAKAYRFVADPRNTDNDERLKSLTEYTGIWDCTHCFYCVQACPKDVAPMERILALRREAIKHGYTDHNGVRHSDSFAQSVKDSGSLNEGRLAVETQGYLNLPALIGLAPVGLRALKAGKMPSPLHHKRPGASQVKRIFNELEKEEKTT